MSTEKTETYAFARNDLLAYVIWYSGFSAVNFFVMGWVVTDYKELTPCIITTISGFFLFQNVLAVVGSKVLKKHFDKLINYIDDINDIETREDTLKPINIISNGRYLKLLQLMLYGLYPTVIIWGIGTIFFAAKCFFN